MTEEEKAKYIQGMGDQVINLFGTIQPSPTAEDILTVLGTVTGSFIMVSPDPVVAYQYAILLMEGVINKTLFKKDTSALEASQPAGAPL